MQNNTKTPIWRLRRGMDRRFRSGHPWVYSNELTESPAGIQPGQLIELADAGGKFLARGFGNPTSLIAFRALTRDPAETNPLEPALIAQKLLKSQRMRLIAGWTEGSYRLCFGDGDEIPGLVIDRYEVEAGQVFVIQAHSAGADRLMPQMSEILSEVVAKQLHPIDWAHTGIVLRNDISVRKREGLTEEPARVLKELPGIDFRSVKILVRPVLQPSQHLNSQAPLDNDRPKKLLAFEVDLLEGQKTGFFLDQFANIQLAALRFQAFPQKKIRILDLFCYVGHWATQLTHVFRSQGKEVEVLAVDASSKALELAKKNVTAAGGKCKTLKMDILEDLKQLSDQTFDIVISDPPALIKSRKDIPVGKHAYLQLATEAMRLVAKPESNSGSGIVCCSCSALLTEEDFVSALAKAEQRTSANIHWIARGTQSPDHPMNLNFPEGRYLKGWIGIKSLSTKG